VDQVAIEKFEIIVLGENAQLDQAVVFRYCETAKPSHLTLVRQMSDLGHGSSSD
jgi:hypothetical protein